MILFIFPHPDDEFAVTAWIRDFIGAGKRVICAYVTDGAFAGQSPERRERESVHALQSLGVPAADILFLGRPAGIADGSLHANLEKALAALESSSVLESISEIYCPAWEGGHQDHDAAHVLALAVAARRPSPIPVWQFSLYNGAQLRGPFFRVMSPLKENGPTRDRRSGWRERLAQIRFCLRYPSQWKSWMGLFPFASWHMLSDGRFQLQPATADRLRNTPHAARPLYERRGSLVETSFRAAVAPFIRSHIGELAPKSPTWILREASAADRDGIIALRRRAFGDVDPEKQRTDFWNWEFTGNPEGRGRLFVAEDRGRIVGHYAVLPQDFVVGKETLKGSIVVDVMTDPDYRFQGMFKKIGQFSLSQVSADIAFATGYPIRKEVMPGHLSIGWIITLKLPVLMRPLAWSALARRFRIPVGVLADVFPGSWRLLRKLWRPRLAANESVDTLAAEAVGELAEVAADGLRGTDIHHLRSPDYLRWRYFESPAWQYGVRGLRRDGKLLAYVISRHATLLQTPSLAIVDLGCRQGSERELAILLDREIADATTAGRAVAGAMITPGHRYYRALRRAGFFPGPYRFTLIVYAAQDAVRRMLTDKRNSWFLTWGDTDDA